MTSFMASAQARSRSAGADDSQAHESAGAEVGLMLAVSAGTYHSQPPLLTEPQTADIRPESGPDEPPF
jgi:hypothetical protein